MINKNDIGNFVNIIFHRQPRHDNVEFIYLGNGAFSLYTETDGRKIKYKSHENYSIESDSPILNLVGKVFNKDWGGPVVTYSEAPAVLIQDSDKGKTSAIIYDKKMKLL